MDNERSHYDRASNPRRRTRTKMDIIKESYLPSAIACIVLLLIIIFVIGSIVRGFQRSKFNKLQEQNAFNAAQMAQKELDQEAAAISAQASDLAFRFSYQEAIERIRGFSGNLTDYPDLEDQLASYEEAIETLTLWNDPNAVTSLSFHVLIEDGQRAFADETYGSSYNRNFVTTSEFRTILQQLYENQYVLVSLDAVTSVEGMSVYLPEGKKPLLLTQTNVNYYNYMIDSDGDKLADAGGDGFASRLILDANGNISCEMTDLEDKTITGPYDLVPILESFIETHPDFSYCNARAVLAVTGYDGIFGYRTNPEAVEYLGSGGYQMEIEQAQQVCDKLRNLGYEFACYTYGNEAYGSCTAAQIEAEMEKWNNEVVPILGPTDILVFAQGSDIADPGVSYSGDKFDVLNANGFTRYVGFCNANEFWYYEDPGYVRIGRMLVTGSNLAHHDLWFAGIMNPSTVLDPIRGDVPA